MSIIPDIETINNLIYNILDERRRAYWEDMKPQPATDEELWCKNCIFRKEENLLSCEKYRDKPGNVLYGGECPYFVERDLK